MVWLSINPDSEPKSSVEVVAAAYVFMADPKRVKPWMMAAYYNRYIDPTVCKLSLSNNPVHSCGDYWQDDEEKHKDE